MAAWWHAVSQSRAHCPPRRVLCTCPFAPAVSQHRVASAQAQSPAGLRRMDRLEAQGQALDMHTSILHRVMWLSAG